MTRRALPILVFVATAASSGAQDVDLNVIHRLKAEAFQNSQVMDHLFQLADVNGPRLSGSPGYRSAADWAVRTLKGWGVDDTRLERWGTFGRGWSLKRFSAHIKEPAYAPMTGIPLAWSGRTNGPVTAPVVAAPLFPEEDRRDQDDIDLLAAQIDAFTREQKGKLRGKIVLLDTPRELKPSTELASQRFDDAKLAELAQAPAPARDPVYEYPLRKLPRDPKKRAELMEAVPDEVLEEWFERWIETYSKLNAFLRDEGVVAVFLSDRRGDGGTAFGEQAAVWKQGAPVPPPVVALPPEPYGRLARLVAKGVVPRVELDVDVAFHEDDLDGYNVVAELPGGAKKDEVVMLGAHLDSWHGGTGATDNAAGSAVVLEAMRLLKTLGLKLDRSVRLALWGGEEQGLFGSRGYVKQHFGDAVTKELKPEQAKLSVYLNIDNGPGKVRGVYLQGNDMARPIFEAWLAPFRDLGATTLTLRNTGGTDHLSFDAVGIPGFQFIQDPLEYGTRTHHSDLDVADHVQPADLMQASAILASFVYNAANRPEMFPRKPLAKPLPRSTATTPR